RRPTVRYIYCNTIFLPSQPDSHLEDTFLPAERKTLRNVFSSFGTKKGGNPPFLVLASVAHALLILFAPVDIGLVLRFCAGKIMFSRSVLSRHVKEIIMFLRVHRRLQGMLPGIGDRSGGQPLVLVGIVRTLHLQVVISEDLFLLFQGI